MKQTKSFEIDMCNGTLMDKLISFRSAIYKVPSFIVVL